MKDINQEIIKFVPFKDDIHFLLYLRRDLFGFCCQIDGGSGEVLTQLLGGSISKILISLVRPRNNYADISAEYIMGISHRLIVDEI
jgi:hypothetical protein